MAFSQSDLDAVNAALASGELMVRTADGKQVTYRSVAELERARQIILDGLASQVAGAGGGARSAFSVRFSTGRGF